MSLDARCKTTAMGTMPHRDIDKALELALSLDIPFWPQLPRITYYEDMFVQFSRDFPGVTIDHENEKIIFHNDRFEKEFASYSEKILDPEALAINEDISIVYHRYLEKNLEAYHSIRGHVTGPINLGFQIIDEDGKPIIYSDELRGLLYDFIQRKVNIQYRQLKQKNKNAFVWLDDPGFWWVFSSTTGYNDVQAKEDYLDFLEVIESPKALHMCVNVNLPYLIELGIEILSIDTYQFENMPKEYANAIVQFIKDGGIISWGIAPTESSSLNKENVETLYTQLTGFWESISQYTGIEQKQIAIQALLAPARCCLRNPEQIAPSRKKSQELLEDGNSPTAEEKLVERAFSYVKEVSQIIKDKYHL